MDENRFVDDEEPIVELVRLLDRERVAMLRIELRHIYGVKEVLAMVLHDEHRHAKALLRNERQDRPGLRRCATGLRSAACRSPQS